MAKAPAFQFYPGDWFREPGLKCVGLNVRGAWAELLLIMWDCNPQGVKESSLGGFARLWRTSLEEAAFIIDQLEIEGIADVSYIDDESKKNVRHFSDYFSGMSPDCPDLSPDCPFYIKVVNRRMFNGWKSKENERLKKRRQREKAQKKNDVPKKSPPLSSTSTSTSTSKPTTTSVEVASLCPQKKIIEIYHEILPELAQVRNWPDHLQKILRVRWKEDPERQSLAWWRNFFQYVKESPFLMGKKTSFQADLEWLVRPQNFAKIANGRYHRDNASIVGEKASRSIETLKAWIAKGD